MRHSADVPKLQKYRAVVAMNFICHQTPALLLGFGMNAGRQGVTLAGGRNVGGLGHYQTGTGPLAIVDGHQLIWDITI
ncbi:hypothetical protein D9M68_735250 [compost metagenome]